MEVSHMIHDPDGQHPTRASVLEIALQYASRGVAVFPLKGKEPLTPHGFKDATTNRSRIHGWWNRYPGANLGIATGVASGLVVVDRDGDSPEAARIWESLPLTLEVATSRGTHRYYQLPAGTKVRSCKLAPDVDLKGEGGYVVAPPSVHPDGTVYSYIEATKAIGIAALPDNVLLEDPESDGRGHDYPNRGHHDDRRDDRHGDNGGPIPEGTRNKTLFFRALALKDAGRSREDALATLLRVNAARCAPPLEAREVVTILRSAYRYPVRGRRTPPEVLEALQAITKRWWQAAWRGVGGKTERDVLRVLLELAERHGHLIPCGVRVSISRRDLAIAAGCGLRTITRVIKRLRVAGWLRCDNADRVGTKAGAFVLLTRPTDHSQSSWGRVFAESVATSSRLPELTPCFRWRGFVGKGRAGALYVLEVLGPLGLEELSDRLGFSRSRDLRRLYLDPLVELGLVVERGGVYALPAEQRYRERVDQVRVAPQGGGPRKVSAKDCGGRWVSRVVEIPPRSEVEREQEDRRQYEKHRECHRRFREPEATSHIANVVADGFTWELEVAPDPDPTVQVALGEFLRRNPHRRDETPSWLAVALWSEEYLDSKPPPLLLEVALVELGRRVA
jgi:hypothetical protein